MKTHRILPKHWWLHPSFDIDLNLPFSYVWFAYWLIIIEWDDYQLPLLERSIKKIHMPAFMPD